MSSMILLVVIGHLLLMKCEFWWRTRLCRIYRGKKILIYLLRKRMHRVLLEMRCRVGWGFLKGSFINSLIAVVLCLV